MTGQTRLRLALAVLAGACAMSASAQAPGPETIPPPFLPYVPTNLHGYYVALLTGSGNGHQITPELFIRHEAYLRRQFETGVLRLAGPFTDRGNVHGIFVLSAATQEAANAIVAADPVVQDLGFTVEMHSALLPDLAPVRAEYPPAPTH